MSTSDNVCVSPPAAARDHALSATKWTWRTRLDAAAALLMLVTSGGLLLELGSFYYDRLTQRTPARVAPPADPIDLQGAAVIGNVKAPVVLVEFGDFQCPVCVHFHQAQLLPFVDKYVTRGSVAFAFRHFPLYELHPLSFAAGRQVACAARQGDFWNAYTLMFSKAVTLAALNEIPQRLGLDVGRQHSCDMQDGRTDVLLDSGVGTSLGVRVTPTLMLGIRTDGGDVSVVRRWNGEPPQGELALTTDQLLAGKPVAGHGRKR